MVGYGAEVSWKAPIRVTVCWPACCLRVGPARLVADGLQLGQPVDREALEGYKYELVVDGGGGSCRTCGVLASDRVSGWACASLQTVTEAVLEAVAVPLTVSVISDIPRPNVQPGHVPHCDVLHCSVAPGPYHMRNAVLYCARLVSLGRS